jgi:putative transposase
MNHCRRVERVMVATDLGGLHMVVSRNVGVLLGDIMRDMKKFTSSKIIAAIRNNQEESRREWLLELFRKAGRENSNNTTY